MEGTQRGLSSQQSLADWIKERIRNSIAECGSAKEASKKLEIEPIMFEYYRSIGWCVGLSGIPEILVKLSKSEDELLDAWQSFYPDLTKEWPDAMLNFSLSIYDCVAFELMYLSLDYAYIDVEAQTKRGIQSETIKLALGARGLSMANTLVRLEQITLDGKTYKKDFTERTTQKWFVSYAADLVMAHFSNVDVSDPEYLQKSGEKARRLHIANMRRFEMH